MNTIIVFLVVLLSPTVFSSTFNESEILEQYRNMFLMRGDHTGNGGDVVLCEYDEVKTIQLLDFYETRQLLFYDVDTLPDENSVEEHFRHFVETMDVSADGSEVLKKYYLARFKKFMARVKWVDYELPDINDSYHTYFPSYCELKQIAVNHLNGVISINERLWNKLNNINKSVLILHELIYEDFINSGYVDSVAARRVVSSLIAGKVIDFNDFFTKDMAHYSKDLLHDVLRFGSLTDAKKRALAYIIHKDKRLISPFVADFMIGQIHDFDNRIYLREIFTKARTSEYKKLKKSLNAEVIKYFKNYENDQKLQYDQPLFNYWDSREANDEDIKILLNTYSSLNDEEYSSEELFLLMWEMFRGTKFKNDSSDSVEKYFAHYKKIRDSFNFKTIGIIFAEILKVTKDVSHVPTFFLDDVLSLLRGDRFINSTPIVLLNDTVFDDRHPVHAYFRVLLKNGHSKELVNELLEDILLMRAGASNPFKGSGSFLIRDLLGFEHAFKSDYGSLSPYSLEYKKVIKEGHRLRWNDIEWGMDDYFYTLKKYLLFFGDKIETYDVNRIAKVLLRSRDREKFVVDFLDLVLLKEQMYKNTYVNQYLGNALRYNLMHLDNCLKYLNASPYMEFNEFLSSVIYTEIRRRTSREEELIKLLNLFLKKVPSKEILDYVKFLQNDNREEVAKIAREITLIFNRI